MELNKAVEIVIEADLALKTLNEFAKEKFNEHFKNEKARVGWRAYKGYDILSPTELRINYEYGGGDMEFDDNFRVDIK